MTTLMYSQRKKIHFENDRFYEHCTCTMVAIFRSDLEKKIRRSNSRYLYQTQEGGVFVNDVTVRDDSQTV